MADNNATTQQAEEQDVETTTTSIVNDPFDEGKWSENPITDFVEKKEEAVVEPPKPAETKEEVPNTGTPNELKTQLGYDKWEDAKAELEQLRKLKDAKPQEIKYANEDSEKLHRAILAGNKKEVYKILEKQERLEQLSSLELNVSNAADVIKTAMSYKYGDLTPAEIEYKFNKQFAVPPKPVQLDTDTDEDYQYKVAQWEQAKKDVETELMIEAKLARPELQKLQSELVLPDIQTKDDAGSGQPSEEELRAAQNTVDYFVKTIDSTVKDFAGFSTAVKYKDGDKDVEIPVSYGFSDDDKAAISKKLQTFAEHGLNANALLAQRWVGDDGTIKTDQVVKDLSLLENSDKMFQKFANEAAAKRLDNYLKEKKNIVINDSTSQTYQPENKDGYAAMVEHFLDN